MKLHFFISGFRNGTLDLDKKLPHLTKLYPEGTIEKKRSFNFDCIKGTNIAHNINLIKFLGEELNSKISIDLYGYSSMCFTCFDISFDLEHSLAQKLVDQKNYGEALLSDESSISIDSKISSFGLLITKYILPYYDIENTLKVEKSLDEGISALNKNTDIMLEKTAIRPYCSTSMMGGMSVGPHGNCLIIKDYDNELDTSGEPWQNIMLDDNSIYLNKTKNILVCKNDKFYDDCTIYHMHCFVRPEILKYADDVSRMFLNTIKKQGDDIKRNIIDDNRNSFYWKELKKKIEVLDLNFLEFYLDMTQISKIDFNQLFSNWNTTSLLKKYRDEYENKIIKMIDNLYLSLDEIKYSLSNLSTPIHTNDEAILQNETEKVNDRILMLSFIAMAVSAIGMIQSDDINLVLKIASGISIFSLPILYYVFRSLQQKISLRKNERNEFSRQLDLSLKGLKQAEKEYNDFKNQKDLPEDFKADVLNFMQEFINSEQLRVDQIKRKIK